MKKSTYFVFAALVLVIGTVSSIYIINHGSLANYSTLITEAYKVPRHVLIVPGSKKVYLSRTGAYGIYFEHNLASSIFPDVGIPPAINCTLTSEAIGTVIEAVPDYVKTNRYRSKDLHAGVLIMSLTVDKPGNYSFGCDYQDGRTEPEIRITLGQNYFWEFLRVVWKIGFPVLGGSSLLCVSVLLALGISIAGIVFKREKNSPKLETELDNEGPK